MEMQPQDPQGRASAPSAEAPSGEALATADDFPYEGAAGRTRREALLVTMPSGAIQSIPAHRVVNVATDPDLRDPALAGVLHRFESGEELAIPFVYHDPAARKMALVLPPSLRHLELAERSKLLDALAADADHPIPAYVRHFSVTVGLDELAEFLALPAPVGSPIDLARREGDLRARENEMFGYEAELRERGHELQVREEAVRRRIEELQAREAALEAREAAAPSESEPQGAELVGDDDVEELADEASVEEADDADAGDAGDGAAAVAAFDAEDVTLLDDEGDELVSSADVQALEAGDAEAGASDDSAEGDDAEPVDVDELSEVGAASDGDQAARIAQLGQADQRLDAALALAETGGPEELEAVRGVLGRMTPGEMAAVFAALCRRGEPAADVLVRALRAPEPYVRHGAALALGELALPRSLGPLAQLVRTEPEDLWQEAARVLARLGKPALNTVTKALGRAQGKEERFAYALAALAEAGWDGEVRTLREKGEPPAAAIAREAMALREVVRGHAEVVQGSEPVEGGDAVRAFSRRFHEALDRA